jgi:hypothetical protein
LTTCAIQLTILTVTELINTILDYLPVADMFRFARTSKRMQEMVYDDTRWIQRLKSMGCWNDVEAKKRFEESMRRKLEAQKAEDARRAGVALNGSSTQHWRRICNGRRRITSLDREQPH